MHRAEGTSSFSFNSSFLTCSLSLFHPAHTHTLQVSLARALYYISATRLIRVFHLSTIREPARVDVSHSPYNLYKPKQRKKYKNNIPSLSHACIDNCANLFMFCYICCCCTLLQTPLLLHIYTTPLSQYNIWKVTLLIHMREHYGFLNNNAFIYTQNRAYRLWNISRIITLISEHLE